MASATVTRSRQALPWTGAIFLIIEVPASQNGNTIDVSTLDGGQGIKQILFSIEQVFAGTISGSTGWTTGTVITVASSAAVNILVIGR